MAEQRRWPKTMRDTDAPGTPTEVIPADLARELYEALKQIAALEASESSSDVSLPKSTLFNIGLTARSALARYEHEVGSDGPDAGTTDYLKDHR